MPRPTHLHCSVNEFQLHEPPLTFGVVYENEKARRWDVACIKCGCMKRYSAAEFASKSVQDFAAIEKGQLMLNENDVIRACYITLARLLFFVGFLLRIFYPYLYCYLSTLSLSLWISRNLPRRCYRLQYVLRASLSRSSRMNPRMNPIPRKQNQSQSVT